MRDIVFSADLFHNESDRKRSEAILSILLAALVETNIDYLKRNPNTPALYRSGVRYEREPGTEIWKAIPKLYSDQRGDCEDLAAARAGELRVKGIAAKPYLKYGRVGGLSLYHVQVQWPDGHIEDPSAILGMGKDET